MKRREFSLAASAAAAGALSLGASSSWAQGAAPKEGKDYIKLVAKEDGWIVAPTGNRNSTYDYPEYKAVSKFGEMERKAILAANPTDQTLPKSPYVGVQFAAIPEFQSIGIAVGQQISAALAGKSSVEDALKAGQVAADREMKKAGYYK